MLVVPQFNCCVLAVSQIIFIFLWPTFGHHPVLKTTLFGFCYLGQWSQQLGDLVVVCCVRCGTVVMWLLWPSPWISFKREFVMIWLQCSEDLRMRLNSPIIYDTVFSSFSALLISVVFRVVGWCCFVFCLRCRSGENICRKVIRWVFWGCIPQCFNCLRLCTYCIQSHWKLVFENSSQGATFENALLLGNGENTSFLKRPKITNRFFKRRLGWICMDSWDFFE